MVSQPEHSTSLALRGPSSLVGHRPSQSHSRARRYNRSHAGGASYAPLNEFPVFSNTGDVEILVKVRSGHEQRYLLHRDQLTRYSGFFEASTSNEWSRAQIAPPIPELPATSSAKALAAGNELARIGEDSRSGSESGAVQPSTPAPGAARRRWRYELDLGVGEGDIPMLVQKEASGPKGGAGLGSHSTSHGPSLFGGPGANTSSSNSGSRGHKSSHSASNFFRSVTNLSLSHHAAPALPPPTHAEQDLLRDYDNLFRIMYNYPPILDGVNIADAYVQCKSLLTLADLYDALAVVGPRVDHHLLQFQSRLWKQIAKYPISYLRLGYLARSKVIFQEALIHVVGQWPAGERSLRAAMPDAVLDIIEDKVSELEETVARVEGRLFRLNLTTRSGERVSPATSYLDWLAVSLFRQWLADNTSPPTPPVPERRRGSRHHSHHHGGAHAQPPPASSDSSDAGAAPPAPPAAAGLASLGRTYRTLGSAHAGAYLAHDECKRFLKLAPELYSRDNLRRLEKRVDELKAMAREVVRPLMGSGLELDVRTGGAGAAPLTTAGDVVGYLTCTRVGERDLPWDE
jgi:hypothetical protein